MGLCRGGNLLLGASCALPNLSEAVMLAAAVEACYVAAVTAAASRETGGMPRGVLRWAPPAVIAAGLGLFALRVGVSWEGAAGAVVAAGTVLWIALGMRADLPAAEAPPKIGALIRCLIPIQAAFILLGAPGPLASGSAGARQWAGALAYAALVYALWPASRLAGRWFRGS